MRVSIDDVRAHPCPTCKMPGDSRCVEIDENGEGGRRVDGVHNTRIHRYQIVTEAVAHNEEIEMSELAVRPEAPMEISTAVDPVARLVAWAETARAAHQIATSLCKTTFVSAQYRDKPHEAAAAILAGAELGIPGPLAALRAFHPINGTPTLSAMAMRAITQSHGHDVRTVHTDDTRAEVAVRRRGSSEWQVAVWTIERAKLAGLVGGKNQNWKTNPTAMLMARATSEGCRWVASDALMGMPYSAEELQDQPELTTDAAPATRRLTTADLDEPVGQVDAAGWQGENRAHDDPESPAEGWPETAPVPAGGEQ